jgi:hypothetical protein
LALLIFFCTGASGEDARKGAINPTRSGFMAMGVPRTTKEQNMRSGLGAFALLLLIGTAQPAVADWCAIYGSSHGGRNCGFRTIDQCLAAISGNGGACQPSGLSYRDGSYYSDYPDRPRRVKRHRKAHR